MIPMSTPTEATAVSAIVVSYNTREMTLNCLRALYADLGDLPAEVWVVDNASTDGSVGAIRAAFPQVRLIANERNLGFGAANNQAMAQASGAYFLLLNSDAFLRPGAIAALTTHMREHPHTAAVGPRLLNADGSLQRSCHRFPSPGRAWLENLWVSAALPRHPMLDDYRRWAHNAPRIVDFVSGACLLVRRVAYEQVGGFDERFFMYAEEADWQRRMTQEGAQVAFTPLAQVTHLAGASGLHERKRVRGYFFASMDYYEWKHHGPVGLVSLRLAMTIGCLLRAMLWTAVAVIPRRRALACAKLQLHTWLVIRQITHWSVIPGSHESRNG